MDHRGHAAHFLTRVDRLSAQHAELALGLYRDHRLVQYLLRQVRVPESSSRVALALDESHNTPHVIVSRDGAFITCLGRGMRVKDATVVSRRSLDNVSQRAGALRDLVAQAQAGGTKERDRLLRRLRKARAALTREEFESLLKWAPLLSGEYLRRAMAAVDFTDRAVRQLKLRPRVGPRDEPLLRAYCEASWAFQHLVMLLTADRTYLEQAFLDVDQKFPESPAHRTLLIHDLMRTMNWAGLSRGALLAASLPELVVPTLLSEVEQEELSLESRVCSLLALLAALLRSPQLEDTVVPVFERWSKREGDGVDLLLIRWAEMLLAIWRNQEPDSLTKLAVALHEGLVAQKGRSPEQRARMGNFSNASKRALFTGLPLAFRIGEEMSIRLVLCLCELCQLTPADFYLPFKDRVRINWTRSEGMLWLEPHLNPPLRYKQRTVVTGPKPGRNEPCPCGSAKKYKRCCGAK